MGKNKHSINHIFKIILLFIFLDIIIFTKLTFGQNSPEPDSIRSQWWYPTLSRNDIKLENHSFYSTKFNQIYVLGDKQNINDTLLAYNNSILLIAGGKYFSIIENCNSVHFDKKNNKLVMKDGSSTLYNRDYGIINPYRKSSFLSYKIDFNTSISNIISCKRSS